MVRKQDWSPRQPAWIREQDENERAYHEWMSRHGITMTSERADSNPNLFDPESDWANHASHWKVVFRRGRKTFTLHYSMGSAHTGSPAAPSVLDSVRSDTGSFEEGGTFEDWARNFGFDADSRRAEAAWRHVKDEVARLKRFLGDGPFSEFMNLPGL